MLELLLTLTPIDYHYLAKVVQVEAAKNTADEYCVAASVLNRVISDKFPDTVSEVVHAPGQYEGIYTHKWIHTNSKLVNKLNSSQGKQNILLWSKVLHLLLHVVFLPAFSFQFLAPYNLFAFQ